MNGFADSASCRVEGSVGREHSSGMSGIATVEMVIMAAFRSHEANSSQHASNVRVLPPIDTPLLRHHLGSQ